MEMVNNKALLLLERRVVSVYLAKINIVIHGYSSHIKDLRMSKFKAIWLIFINLKIFMRILVFHEK